LEGTVRDEKKEREGCPRFPAMHKEESIRRKKKDPPTKKTPKKTTPQEKIEEKKSIPKRQCEAHQGLVVHHQDARTQLYGQG